MFQYTKPEASGTFLLCIFFDQYLNVISIKIYANAYQYMIQQEMYPHQKVNWIQWVFKQNWAEFNNINTFNFVVHITNTPYVYRKKRKETNTATAQGFCCSWKEHMQLLNSLVIMQLWCRLHQHIWKDYATLRQSRTQELSLPCKRPFEISVPAACSGRFQIDWI